MDRAEAEHWIRSYVEPAAPIELTHDRPWSSVLRVPLARGSAWFKACADLQAFEAGITARLAARWPGRVADVLAHDDERAWLLMADAGTPLAADGNPPDAWLELLPRYAELQRGEAAYVDDHLAHAVPDQRPATFVEGYDRLLASPLPIDDDESTRLRAFAPEFARLADELSADGIPASVQHDDLHHKSVYRDDCGPGRVLDWGDSSISHPFVSLVVTFRFLEEVTGLAPGDRWFSRLRQAYLEPWGDGLEHALELALRVGAFAHLFTWFRQRERLAREELAWFDEPFATVLRRALARIPS